MPHRAHLFSLRIGHALREACLTEPYSRRRLLQDLMAGVTVGIIAIPLAMALGIASGVAPQHGLYTAIIAGFVIAASGGSRFSVSGPTAAFVVILYPVVQKFGLAGLMVASLMAGAILIGMAALRLGRLIEYIPEAVTLGFTAGIGIVIATLQIKDFFGLDLHELPESFVGKASVLVGALPQLHLPSLAVAATTLAVMLLWPRLKTPVPAHLPAVLIGTLLALALNARGLDVATIGSRFSYTLADGSIGHGIPSLLPQFMWPWQQPGAGGGAMDWSLATIEALIPAAFSIAMLGAIESLLCAVVLDGMTGKRHSANSELLGQGLGNLIAPFFGGITATAAIARSAANLKAGATSPIAAMIHAVVVLLALVMLASLLSYLPMASMAALLLVVAWNMSEAHKAVHLVKTSPRGDIAVFVTCFALTVLFDMVIAITSGILLAAVLFMRDIAQMTKIDDITGNRQWVPTALPPRWRVIRISGPLFFAAADRVFGELGAIADNNDGLVIQLEAVPLLDGGGLAAMQKFIAKCVKRNTRVIFSELQFQPLKTLRKANVQPLPHQIEFAPSLQAALVRVICAHNHDESDSLNTPAQGGKGHETR